VTAALEGMLFSPGGAAMDQVRVGDVVRVHFRGRLANGSEFGSSAGRAPIRFTAGGKDMIRGLSEAVLGMRVGERRTVGVTPADGFGPRRPGLLQRVPRERLPAGSRVGDLVLGWDGGAPVRVWVRLLGDGYAVVDGNHPLAGEDLEFDIKLVAIGRGRASRDTKKVESMPKETVNAPGPAGSGPNQRPDVPALIRGQVIQRLGEPEQLVRVQVRPLWDNRYRVNVFVGPDAATARIAHGYFVTVDSAGAIVASEPAIRRRYAEPVPARPAGSDEAPPVASPS
jgi:peptidylprolyl isomerase